jgi:NAD(P)-dependent dehydrogenase (short-subunit alcohol dehydrogenase family)
VSTTEVAVVTGAGSGVGSATARLLAEQGSQVVGVDRRWPEGAMLPAGAARVSGDVTDPATWTEVLAAAEEHGGAPSQLALNAGMLAVGSVLEVAESDLRAVFEVNVFAAALALRSCLPAMIERGGGAVVAVASTDSLFAEQGLAAYCSSKGALLQLIRCAALDHARAGVRANCVCPGAIDTPFFRRHVDAAREPDRFLEEKVERHPAGRILEPIDVAEVVAFLLSPRSRGMTGAAVTVDGGLTATFDFQSSAVG